MFNCPPFYPQQPFDCRRPCNCRPNRPDFDCPWDLSPANLTANVLGVDSCGGIIIRLSRCQDHRVNHCNCR